MLSFGGSFMYFTKRPIIQRKRVPTEYPEDPTQFKLVLRPEYLEEFTFCPSEIN